MRMTTNTRPTPDTTLDEPLTAAVADAESLLNVVAWPDEPYGVRIVELTAPGVWGLCSGSGHGFARAVGIAAGCAIMVASRRIASAFNGMTSGIVEELLAELRVPATTAARFTARCRASAAVMGTVAIEQTATHELAHALAADIDPALDEARAQSYRKLPSTFRRVDNPDVQAAAHGPAWAAAVAILYRRCQAIRGDVASKWASHAATEFHRYGMNYAAVAEALAAVTDDAAIRPLLSDRAFMTRVEAVMPSMAERAEIIASQHTAPTGVPPVAAADVSGGREAAIHDERDEQ